MLKEDRLGEGSEGDDRALDGGRSPRRWWGNGPEIYDSSLVCRLKGGMGGRLEVGERERLRCPGEGVDAADALSEYVPPSDSVLTPEEREASAAAVIVAASSMVPE